MGLGRGLEVAGDTPGRGGGGKQAAIEAAVDSIWECSTSSVDAVGLATTDGVLYSWGAAHPAGPGVGWSAWGGEHLISEGRHQLLLMVSSLATTDGVLH